MASVFRTYSQAFRTWGVRETLRKMYMLGEIKFGNLVGEDANGNKYFENNEYAFGQHRWVEYKDIHNYDASTVMPEWHGWLHHTFDEPPVGKLDVGKDRIETSKVSDVPFRSHVGKVAHPEEGDTQNFSTYRPRGYGVGNLQQKFGEPSKFYRQPAHPEHPLSNRGGRFVRQKGVESWDPADPAGEKAKKPIRSVDDL